MLTGHRTAVCDDSGKNFSSKEFTRNVVLRSSLSINSSIILRTYFYENYCHIFVKYLPLMTLFHIFIASEHKQTKRKNVIRAENAYVV